MSDDVTIYIRTDTTDIDASIEETAAKADEVVREWATQRRTILSQVREAFSMINSLISTFRGYMSIIGAQIDPFFDVILGMISSTISMLVAVATAYYATVILAPWAVVVSAAAAGLAVVTFAKSMSDKAEMLAKFANVKQQLSMAAQRSPIGGSF